MTTIVREAFFRCVPSGAHFLYADKVYMRDNFPKKVIDGTGTELTPGASDACLGNREMGFECCCDECEYFLVCFPEFDSNSEEYEWDA